MTIQKVQVVERILDANDQIAAQNKEKLDQAGVYSINIMASPGSGKTSVILRTIEKMMDDYKIAVIEGDTAPVTIDADKITAMGIPAVQINTGGQCHLDANLLERGISALNLKEIDLVIVENVGNLICPASFKIGTHASIVISSVPEGDDKPYKYPNIYRGIDTLILNKIDLLPYVDFRKDYFEQGIELLNPGLSIFELSCKTGDGFDQWIEWLKSRISNRNS